MRRKIGEEYGKPVFANVRWGGHWGDCEKCLTVNIDKPATFANTCAEGAPLLMEFLVDKQRPAQKEKERQVREWAKKAGVFKM